MAVTLSHHISMCSHPGNTYIDSFDSIREFHACMSIQDYGWLFITGHHCVCTMATEGEMDKDISQSQGADTCARGQEA